VATALAALVACSACSKGSAPAPAEAGAPLVAEIADAGPDTSRDEAVAAARAAYDAGRYDGPLIGAMNMVTSVMDVPAWPENDAGIASVRLGYLRHGAKVAAIAEPIVNEGCSDGWYELVEGGFVCGKGATLDLKNPRVRLAPKPPDMTSPLPYRYGYNVADGTPLYRRVLSVDDRKKYEPWLAPPAPAAAASADPASGDDPAPSDDPTAGSASALSPPPIAATASAAPSASVPWYLRDRDAGRPQVMLGELRGRGVLVRRMVHGFYLALDREFKAAHAKWWRTTGGLAVPFEKIVLQPKRSDYHGLWSPTGDFPDGGARPEPSGLMAFATSYTRSYVIDPEKKTIGGGASIPRRAGVELAKATFAAGGSTYQQTTDGSWVRLGEVLVAHPAPPPDLAPNEKWIDVDVTRQIVLAFEGARPVFGTLVSTGKRNMYDKDHDYPTPPGAYRIREKHITATMDGDVAGVGPYSIEDVPWVMFFQGSYALHGAFWHDSFGHVMSHGCVNMSPADAKALFAWVDPQLPAGWHGVFATDAHPGTRVIVHEDPPPKGSR